MQSAIMNVVLFLISLVSAFLSGREMHSDYDKNQRNLSETAEAVEKSGPLYIFTIVGVAITVLYLGMVVRAGFVNVKTVFLFLFGILLPNYLLEVLVIKRVIIYSKAIYIFSYAGSIATFMLSGFVLLRLLFQLWFAIIG